MAETKERRGKTGLLGPKRADKWMEWRKTRDNAIANPRRNAAAQKLNNPKSQDRESAK